MNKKHIQNAIDSALNYLEKEQEESGGFTSVSSSSPSLSTDIITRRTSFVPSLILSSLKNVDTEQAYRIRHSIASFLLTQKSDHWSYNYWVRTSTDAKELPYPDDLDDTFCALIALYHHDPSLIDENALAKMTKLLIATESKPGGPYRTWLVSRSAKKWQDVDVAVNANVSHFLSLVAVPSPPLTTFLEGVITKGQFNSPYYPTSFPLFYYLARSTSKDATPALIQHINMHKTASGYWKSPLHTALSCSALAHLGVAAPEAALEYLLMSQNQDGSWPAEAFCIDPTQNGLPFYGGSSALSTAFVLEALQHPPIKQPHSQVKPQQNKPPTQFLSDAREDLRALDPFQRKSAVHAISNVIKSKNGSEVALLPHSFHTSLASPSPIDPLLLKRLGLANLYGWAGYTLLDDILDADSDATLLPTAHLLTRRSLKLFLQSGDEPFSRTVYAFFDEIDSANTWEMTHARFPVSEGVITIGKIPRYKTIKSLAARSSGHILPVVGVLATLGLPPNSPRSQAIQSSLRYYIAARQLNDDAHDWKEDLSAGRITYVVAMLLKECGIQPGTYTLDVLIPTLEKRFWNHTLSKICGHISECTQLSREEADKSQLLLSPNFLEKGLERIDTVVSDTLQSVAKAKRFLRAYRGD